MKDPRYTMRVIWGTTVALVTFGMVKKYVREPVLERALQEGKNGVQNFEQSVRSTFTPLQNNQAKTLVNFKDVVCESKELCKQAAENSKKIKFPEAGEVKSISEIKDKITIVTDAMNNLFDPTKMKFRVQHVVQKAGLHMVKNSNDILAVVGVSTILNNPPFNPITSGDAVNASDLADTSDLPHIGHDMLGGIVSDELLDTAVETAGFLLLPGVLSSTKSIFREFDMLANNETSLGDSLKNGIIPTAGGLAATAIGFKIDLAFGGALFGIPTAIGWLAGRFIKKSGAKADLKSGLESLGYYQEKIQTRKNEAVYTISESISDNFKDFPEMVKNCPSFSSQKNVMQFMDRMAVAYELDTKKSMDNAKNLCQEHVEKLPKRNWVDKALGINRSEEIKKMYQQSCSDMTMVMAQSSSNFKKIASADHEKAAITLMDGKHLANGQVSSLVNALSQEFPTMVDSHYSAIDKWKQSCADTWKNGTEAVRSVSNVENEKVDSLVTEHTPRMKELRQEIRNNLRRLNMDVNLCPA